MILATLTIKEHEGISMIAQPMEATPFEIDVARQFAEFLKTIRPPQHSKTNHIIIQDQLDNFKNS